MKKHKGADSILYNATVGALVTVGQLADDSWYRIHARGGASALPAMDLMSIFRTPQNTIDAITLAAGDEVHPLTLTEICKVDVSISGEQGVIDTTDSCDYPYMSNMADGFTNLSGTINTMLRFDDATDELVPVTKEFLKRFYTIIEDDGTGAYTVTAKDESDLILQILMNKDSVGVAGQKENWLITPAILNSIANNMPLKDVFKGDYSWTKGQGPASTYIRTVV